MLNNTMEVPVCISVIVPSLNSSQYIRKCIESVLNQTLQQIEILCVDAGSADGTMEILEEYAAKDARVCIIKSDRKSYGYQLNLGIEQAQGQYIGIVETDDFIDAVMYQKLYSYAQKGQPDFIKGGFYDYAENETGKFVYENHMSGATGKLNDLRKEREKGFHLNHIWAGIYRRTFLLEKGIRFNETSGASYQDTGFSMLVGLLADTCIYTEGSYYYYRRNNENSSVKSSAKWRCIIDELEYVTQEMIKKGRYSADTQLYIWKYKPIFYFWNFERLPEKERELFLVEIRWELEEYTKNKVIGSSLNDIQKEMIEVMKNKEKAESYFAEKEALESKYERLIMLAKQGEKCILVGAGRYGENMLRLQKIAGIRYIDAVADNNAEMRGCAWNEYIVAGVEEAVRKYGNHWFVIANKKHSEEICRQLAQAGIQEEKILIFDRMLSSDKMLELAAGKNIKKKQI